MRNATGDVIYVGKAVSLRNRVRSYFQEGLAAGPKVRAMVSHIHDFDYIITDSEVEALILECNLIKEKGPKYNIRLKDDKSFPFLKITNESFPRVVVVRRPSKQDRVFGPYTDAHAVRETTKLLRKLFPLRTCSLDLSEKRDYRPCLLYHIGLCNAPCANLQSEAEYQELVDQVVLFLEGRHEQILPELQNKMQMAAEQKEYERAARLRDQIRALQKVIEKQKIVTDLKLDQDVLGLALGEDGTACVQVFNVRSGKVTGSEHFLLEAGEERDAAQILTAFVEQHYANAAFIPKEVLLPVQVEEPDIVATWLTQLRGSRVKLYVPKRGDKRQLVEMVTTNAETTLAQIRERKDVRQRTNEAGLRHLQEVLSLPDLPHRIEAYDISNFQGGETVASMVVLVDGEPVSSEYRRFKIRTVDGPNDFASMQEVIRRRFVRALKEREEIAALPEHEQSDASLKAKFAQLPDLVLIDGGKGQLHAAREIMRQLDLAYLPTVGLAKREEEIFVEDRSEPILLDRHSPSMHIVQRVRDEAHRFAITYHRQLRDKKTTVSALDKVVGVGPARKRALIKHFGSVRGVREATVDQLVEVPGIPRDVAQRIYEELGRSATSTEQPGMPE
jgi:excinuclease ABC subunit C